MCSSLHTHRIDAQAVLGAVHAPVSRIEDKEAVSHLPSRDDIGLGFIAARAHSVYCLMKLSISHADEESHLCELSDHLFSCISRHGIALPAFEERPFIISNCRTIHLLYSLSHTHTCTHTPTHIDIHTHAHTQTAHHIEGFGRGGGIAKEAPLPTATPTAGGNCNLPPNVHTS